MRKAATMLVIALAISSAKQAQAVELLVRVAGVIEDTQIALAMAGQATNQVASIRLHRHMEQQRVVVVSLLQGAMQCESAAMGALCTLAWNANGELSLSRKRSMS